MTQNSIFKSQTDYLEFVILLLEFKKLGLTGFDRMCGGVCQHAGSWDESLER